MQYDYEIRSAEGSRLDVREPIMFGEEHLFVPILHLHGVAQLHFRDLGPSSIGERLDLHRLPIDGHRGPGETVFCSAVFRMFDGVPTVHMMAGPLFKQMIYGH